MKRILKRIRFKMKKKFKCSEIDEYFYSGSNEPEDWDLVDLLLG